MGWRRKDDGFVQISSTQGETIRSKALIACCGLQADDVAIACGLEAEPKIVPFRGEWLQMSDESSGRLLRGMIYPVPQPQLPFLGIHFTKNIETQRVWMGPNAILTLSKTSYSPQLSKAADLIDLKLTKQLTIGDLPAARLLKLTATHWRAGISELSHRLFPALQLREAQRYLPDVSESDFLTERRVGIRAQAVSHNGLLIDDFLIQTSRKGRQLHVRNAPSPAATSSLAIAEEIVHQADLRLSLSSLLSSN